ncbi:MAG TPA: GspH/FimT family pseudopilin [Sulfuricaulis sp.]|nr:GspH/FimT family pseudopilin [Sulfuricaulis sp.]
MYHRNRQPGCTLKNGTPFICLLAPFVGRKNTVISPFIGKNIPLVGIASSGLTLVELIITLTIVGILATIAVPGMDKIIKNQRMTAQANDVVADLNIARSEAVKRATWVTVCKTTNPNAASPTCDTTAANQWSAGRIIFVDSGSGTSANDGNGVLNSNEVILRITQGLEGGNKLHGDSTYTGTSNGTANKITYLATGMTNLVPKAGDAENQLVLCDNRGPSQARRIAVNTTGKVRVTKTNTNLDASSLSCP